MLTASQFFYPLPVFVLSATVTALMLSIAFYRNKVWNSLIVLSGLVLALLTTHPLTLEATKNISELVILDRFACFFIVLMIFATFVCISLAHSYLQQTDDNREEMYLLMTLSLIGGVVLVSSHHFASLFIGLEILSVPIYALVAYSLKNTRSLESGIKYLVLSATGSALMLFGIALLYAYSGTLSFSGITEQLAGNGQIPNSLVLIGALLVIIALCFKLSLAPFHLWTPDVYEGAPAPVSAFIATVAKIAVAAVLVRLITDMPLFQELAIKQTLMVLAALSMLAGNILAITQNNIKRLFAYSSISHFGYLLVGIISLHADIRETSMIYILVYALTSLVAFGVISLVSSPLIGNDADNLILNYQGLYKKQPLLAIVMTIAMLSMAGIPLTAGFIGKFYLIAAGVNASLWSLLAIMVIGSAIGIYYYLRVTIALFKADSISVDALSPIYPEKDSLSIKFNKFVLLLIAFVIIFLGVYPQPMFDLIMP